MEYCVIIASLNIKQKHLLCLMLASRSWQCVRLILCGKRGQDLCIRLPSLRAWQWEGWPGAYLLHFSAWSMEPSKHNCCRLQREPSFCGLYAQQCFVGNVKDVSITSVVFGAALERLAVTFKMMIGHKGLMPLNVHIKICAHHICDSLFSLKEVVLRTLYLPIPKTNIHW